MYEISSKVDFQTGAALIVKIPEEETDKKALYTILADKPDFILPFRHRSVDGQIEFTYQIGNRSKLTYLSGNRLPEEYADLWVGIIQPLIDCGDWFMTPYSFVLKTEYLYCDKNGKSVGFIYIPSVRACSDYHDLKEMVTVIAKQNHVTDINLENKVVWAIQDFCPEEFLQIIKPYRMNSGAGMAPASEYLYMPQIKSDDISIDFPVFNGKAPKEKKQRIGLFGPKKDKKPVIPQKKEIIQGAALIQTKSEPGQSVFSVLPFLAEPENEITQIDYSKAGIPKFIYSGAGDHPKFIEIMINEGGIFTIGRFDSSIGIKQSNFEFEKKTKAVSRRHAAIERNLDGYNIIDLDSAVGTFIDGKKLPPGAPFKLTKGCKVSFGQSGADYIWDDP